VEEILRALEGQQRELDGLLAPLDDAAWGRPTPCEGWTIADVVLHLVQTNDMAIASATGRFAEELAVLAGGIGTAADVDEGAARMVERDRGMPVTVLFERWRDGARALREALARCDPHARVAWVAGDLSARTLATTRLAETWIHTGDVASALGETLEPTVRLWHIARLAWRTIPYSFARAGEELSGPVAFHLRGPAGEAWSFDPSDGDASTTITGDAVDLCSVAGRRTDPATTSLVAEGPDGAAVLRLVRTYA
jgi:uncharacterized protein (TIGR03084 family)